ncbi:metallophosphoesterase [Streptomyces sp. RB6PN25]|uniref:Metallophosphoesterase n=1 Tax=Streptomyces humicola TaxID=2953240 RepID=A0ABT1Q341_9ACTN|nr:metallophosphoesterase [Streptomyces humicola]MCQ4084348.1 metallophosphoesterase [Streptomyces humicola]
MKLLLFSDLHLDTPFRWARPQLARARRLALRQTLERIRDLAISEDVDALLCAGDLYEHDRVAADTGAFLCSVFGALHPRPVFLAPGNHDWYGPSSLYRQVDWPSNVHVFTEARLSPVELADGLTLWGAAHRAPANTDGFLDGFRVDRGGVNVALFHGSEQSELPYQESGKAPHAPFRAAQIREAGLDHALLGHFHLPKDAETHTYPGNPDPLEFGETGERGAVIVTVTSDGTVARTRQRVAHSEVHDVTVRLDGVEHTGQVRERVAAAVAAMTGIARVTLEGEVAPDINVRAEGLEGVAPHLEALVARLGAVRPAYDLAALAEEATVRGQFVRDVQAAAHLDEDTRRRVLITGLRAFDGRADELEVR